MDPTLLGLDGKVALVTGGGGNIGQGIAIMLARAGCDICVVDIDPPRAQQTVKAVTALGRKAAFVKADVTKLEQVETMPSSCVKELGGLDVAVNNLGGFAGYTHMSYLDMTPRHFEDVVGFNFWTAFFCQQAEAKSMVQRKVKGSIINISSGGALRMRWGDMCYTACKAAIIKLTKDAAFELGPHGIRVNVICPGFVPPPGMEQRTNLQPIAELFPLGRLSTREEIGGAAVFLASNLASYVTGHTLPVDSGDSETSLMGGSRVTPWAPPVAGRHR